MALVTVVDVFQIMIQAQDAKTFTGKNGEKITLDARKARDATCIIAECEEYTLPLILPEHFDSSKVTKGCVLNVTCRQLEQLQPMQIQNVNRILTAKKS